VESNDEQTKAENELDKYDVCLRFFGVVLCALFHLRPKSLTTRFEADVFCGVFHVYQSHHVSFSPRLHRLLAYRNLPLILDIYASDGPNENA